MNISHWNLCQTSPRWFVAIAVFGLIGAVFLTTLPTPVAYAGTISGLTITANTPYAPLDSNNSCGSGPTAMYIQVDITNTTGAAINNLSANISSFTTASSWFTMTLAPGQAATQSIGDLGAGQAAHLYWYVFYG